MSCHAICHPQTISNDWANIPVFFAKCHIYEYWKRAVISLVMHICITNHPISFVAAGDDQVKTTSGPFYLHGLTLISAWISNYIHYKLWDEITYPLLNFNGTSLGMNKWFHPTFYWACDYLSMLGLKLNHISKRGPKPNELVYCLFFRSVYN